MNILYLNYYLLWAESQKLNQNPTKRLELGIVSSKVIKFPNKDETIAPAPTFKYNISFGFLYTKGGRIWIYINYFIAI